MRIGIKILPKNEVLDVQGRAVGKSVESLGLKLTDCKVGKYIVFELNETNAEVAKAKVSKIALQLLTNDLIEKYELEVL